MLLVISTIAAVVLPVDLKPYGSTSNSFEVTAKVVKFQKSDLQNVMNSDNFADLQVQIVNCKL